MLSHLAVSMVVLLGLLAARTASGFSLNRAVPSLVAQPSRIGRKARVSLQSTTKRASTPLSLLSTSSRPASFDTSDDFGNNYDPSFESKVYEWWESSNAFDPGET